VHETHARNYWRTVQTIAFVLIVLEPVAFV
jgi:hypothetical protein